MAKKSLKMHKRASTETELENAQFYFFDEEIFLVPPFNFDFLMVNSPAYNGIAIWVLLSKICLGKLFFGHLGMNPLFTIVYDVIKNPKDKSQQ